ncbi:hypothetical protein PV677_35965 [Streptomyces sp. DE06-01C]|uniref:hypothetical protein n=1 Tax=Streptomyces sp. DE06-01C TaxID=3028656 RepID=UPI0029C1CC5D|nr:hypothetical protein [Streptomyces sp. DE06-01C]MDX5526067.1 hypothetical protein [Streptomyces sp. DE06-01C]
MRTVRGVGAVAVGMAAVVLVSGCSGGGDGGGDGGAKASSSPSVSPSPSVVPPEPPAAALTAEEKVDALAEAEGWLPDEVASAYVADICATLTDQEESGPGAVQWLTLDETDAEHAAVLKAGVPLLCPEWSKTVTEVLGAGVRFYSDGTYRVTGKPGSAADAIAPGRYRVVGTLEDCYWERTSRGGEILDNGFATSARDITVTIRPSDGQFTARGCGVWKPVE